MELPADIAATIPPEHLANEQIQRFGGVPDLVKGYIEMQDYRGRSVALPSKESKPEDIQKWTTETNGKLKDHGYALGRLADIPAPAPATADDYQFKVDGVTPEQLKDDKLLGEFRAFAHANGLSNEKAQSHLDWYLNKIIPGLKGGVESIEMVEDQLTVDRILTDRFKDEAPLRKEEFNRAVESLSATIPDLKDFLEGTAPNGKAWIANKNHPAMVQLLSEVNRLQAQDFGGNINGRNVLTGDAANLVKEANDIIGNKENPQYKLYWGGDKETVDHVNGLFSKAHPGTVEI